jgi:hypothetical protein
MMAAGIIRGSAMQFRLSTILLVMFVFSTSLSLAGPWGILLAGYVVLLVGVLRACISGRKEAEGCLMLLAIMGLSAISLPVVLHADPYPYFWLAWIASIIVFFVHGVVYDIRQKRQEKTKAATEPASEPSEPT